MMSNDFIKIAKIGDKIQSENSSDKVKYGNKKCKLDIEIDLAKVKKGSYAFVWIKIVIE